jgi:LysR family cys regulon transcriptional activator
MKLQQLRFVAAVAQNELNITTAASKLSATQPAVSKQIKLLEEELGFKIFVRSGRTLTKITAPGERVVGYALQVMREVQNIKAVAAEFNHQDRGTLSIGTTHTQARYVLPTVIQEFRRKYPHVQLHLHEGTPEQIAEMVKLGRVDFAIATDAQELFRGCVFLPSHQWFQRIIVPLEHPLADVRQPSLKQLARFPIITSVISLRGPSSLHERFARGGLTVNVALTARDADVIKTYVRLGMGVGIVADAVMNPKDDADLISIDASHLFPAHTTWIGFARGGLLREFMYDFVNLATPHISRKLIDRAAACKSQEEVDALFQHIPLPTGKFNNSSAQAAVYATRLQEPANLHFS